MTRHKYLRAAGLVLVFPLAIAACGNETPVGPPIPSLVGVWTLVGFTDGERVAVSSGNWVFFDDGVMATDLTVTFPNESTSFLASVGRYEQMEESARLQIRGRWSTWTLEFTDSDVVMIQTTPDPADNTITLRRH